MTLPRLYSILDVEACVRVQREPLDVLDAWLSAGVRLVQLRAKSSGGAAFLQLACAVGECCRRAGALYIVNDRADIARLAEADGLHVGQDDLPVADARRIVGGEAILGLSTHSDAQVTAGMALPASYLAIGPVFGTGTKDTGYEAVGLDQVRRAVAIAGARPVVAIGGITLDRAPAVIHAGAASVAVISDLLTDVPEARARAFVAALA